MGYGAPPPDWSTPGPPQFPPPGGGYGGPPGGGYGGPPPPGFPPAGPPPGPPRRNSAPLIIVAVVAVLVIVGAVVIVLVSRGDGGRPVAASTTPTVTPTPTPTPSGPFPPVVPGWQVVVASEKNGLSYDVPANWTVNGEDTSIGLDDGSAMPETTVSFSAKSEKGHCTLGGAGFKSTDVDDLRSSATQAAQKWAKSAEHKVGSPRKTIGSPGNVELKGLYRVVQITARVSHAPDPGNCGSTGTTIRIVILPVTGGGSLSWVLYVHTGQPGALSDADMDKMVRSVRLAK